VVNSGSAAAYYVERVRVPFSYWAIGLFFGLTFVSAVSFMLGDAVFYFSILAVTGLVAWTLLAWGSLAIVVDSVGIRVGRSRLEWAYVGQVSALDRGQRGRVLARDDVHLALRPYASGVVVIGVSDDADPHLCWMVSTRDPDRLVAAVEHNRPSGAVPRVEETALDSGE